MIFLTWLRSLRIADGATQAVQAMVVEPILGPDRRLTGPQIAAPPTTAPRPGEAAEAWAAVKDTTSIAQLEVIATRYKGTVYANLATSRRKIDGADRCERVAWSGKNCRVERICVAPD